MDTESPSTSFTTVKKVGSLTSIRPSGDSKRRRNGPTTYKTILRCSRTILNGWAKLYRVVSTGTISATSGANSFLAGPKETTSARHAIRKISTFTWPAPAPFNSFPSLGPNHKWTWETIWSSKGRTCGSGRLATAYSTPSPKSFANSGEALSAISWKTGKINSCTVETVVISLLRARRLPPNTSATVAWAFCLSSSGASS
mmetsp:Transcript_31376/g.40219  ORF Transcript_31376/g.40219 Transcript_31376/m.40219 type:complete len:200 (+) Transcript_31376:437-1036(+)